MRGVLLCLSQGTFCDVTTGCVDQCFPCQAYSTSAAGAAQCRCIVDTTLAAGGAGDAADTTLDGIGIMQAGNIPTPNVDSGLSCIPACAPGQYHLTRDASRTAANAGGPRADCKKCPVKTYCPSYMTFGCSGTDATACLACQGDSLQNTDGTGCVCPATGYTNLDNAADGSGCVLSDWTTRR